jgi:UDP-N-acetylglucosamine 2-epimerase (non-hydrolysing)
VKLLCVVGARPNFIKMAALLRSLEPCPVFETRLVHTGQHYDPSLSDVFFRELGIPPPDVELSVGSGTHAVQTAEIMRGFEPVLEAEQPSAVLVVGDVNSTLACALTTAKFRRREPATWAGRPRLRPVLIHVEAGLRSFDDDMPEEANRRLTDALADLLFVSDRAGLENLSAEGVPAERVHFVGNVMVDTLMAARDLAGRSRVLERLGRAGGDYGLVTLHRPANVDDPRAFRALLGTLDEIASRLHLVFLVHPRTRARLRETRIVLPAARWTLAEPVGYLDSLRLQSQARVILTDSGGVQEEATALGVPCVTLRENTERPCTVSEGTNLVAGTGRDGILRAFEAARRRPRGDRLPALWDGKAADRIVEILARSSSCASGPRAERARRTA